MLRMALIGCGHIGTVHSYALGQLARGVFVIGQLAVGVVVLGQLALGVVWSAGMLALGGLEAHGFGIACFPRNHSFEGEPPGRAVLRAVGMGVILLAFVFLALIPLWNAFTRTGGARSVQATSVGAAERWRRMRASGGSLAVESTTTRTGSPWRTRNSGPGTVPL